MDFLDLIKERYSCRDFSKKIVENEKIDKILEAARFAPTARNLQPQRVLVLTKKEQLQKISACTQYGFNAPVIMIVFYDILVSYKRYKYDNKEFGDIDVSIITTQMMLEAQNLGLGTTWIGSFDSQKLVELYQVPKNLIPVSILAIGYPSSRSKPSKFHYQKNSLDSFVYWNKL